MKGKSLISLLLIGMLLLSGCGKEQPVIRPVYDAAPVQSDGGVYVNGVLLSSYTKGETVYLKIDEFAGSMGGSWAIQPGIDEHECFLTNVFGGTTAYSTKKKEAADSGSIGSVGGGLYDGESWYQPAEDLLSQFELNVLEDEETNTVYYTSYPKAEEIPEGVRVPVMMYHAVGDDYWGIKELFVSPASLREQLEGLQRNNYTPIWFEDLSHVDQLKKPILLTFDDGYENNYTELFPIIKEYNVKVTISVITGKIGTENYLTAAQIKEMAASGLVSFQSHTASHENLTALSAARLKEELQESKLALARITGKEPFVVCYPNGKFSDTVAETASEYYEFGMLMSGETYVTGAPSMKIYRKYVSRSMDIKEYGALIAA